MVGAVEISRSDPNILYVGMGEPCIAVPRLHWTPRGDGVYKSTDGGKSWKNMGLSETRQIARIRVHPIDPDIVYEAAIGTLDSPGQDRGVYRSKDGGNSWDHILFRSETAGCRDISIDPDNPRVIYAALWDAQRSNWNSYSGGPGSTLYRSVDGGDHWEDITNNHGLPQGYKGRIAVAVSPVETDLVWALFDMGVAHSGPDIIVDSELEPGGLFCSKDGGESWEQRSSDRQLTMRPHYYNHLFADTGDADTVYVLNQPVLRSDDGGRTFVSVEMPHYDQHDLWIDPDNPKRLAIANDGGAMVSFNRGHSWSTIYNQPTGEYYHVATDNRFPYRIYATQQDNTALSTPSRSNRGAISWTECYNVGSAESGHIAVDPRDPNVVYSGAFGSYVGAGPIMLRYDHKTGQSRSVTVWPDVTGLTVQDRRYRFEWDSPIVFSPHDPTVIYSAANVVFKTTDEGTSWQVISPDLTRKALADKEEIDLEINIAPYERSAIARLAESPIEPGLIWIGTTDGVVQLSRDGGKNWSDVTPKELPENCSTSAIEASYHDPGTAYISATNYQVGDYRPYLFRTIDYGSSWTSINDGIDPEDFTRVIREDPNQKELIFTGTEGGPYVSFDAGGSWEVLQLNLPSVPIHDMVINGTDLVVATHGRAIWILDDLTPLHEIAEGTVDNDVHLFKPRSAHRFITDPDLYSPKEPGPAMHHQMSLGIPASFYLDRGPEGQVVRRFIDSGENPPNGVMITYYLNNLPQNEITIRLSDSSGEEIGRFSSDPTDGMIGIPANQGTNRFVWDMLHSGTCDLTGKVVAQALVPTGSYRVELIAGDSVKEQSFEILKDPRISSSDVDLKIQSDLLLDISRKLSEGYETVRSARAVVLQLDEWLERTKGQSDADGIVSTIQGLKQDLKGIENDLIKGPDWPTRGAFYPRDFCTRLLKLFHTVSSADGIPTDQSKQVFDELSSAVDKVTSSYSDLGSKQISDLNLMLRDTGVPAIKI